MDPHASEGGGESIKAGDKEENAKCSETSPPKDEESLSLPQIIPSQIDKYTDTSSTHKFQMLQEASVNAKIEKAKKDFTEIFGKEELDFFEKLFRVVNIAQDGFLNDLELLFFLDQHDYIISKQEARQIIKESDTNKDQVLDFSEFLALCKKAELNLKEIGVLDKGETESQLQNSLKIRNIFRCIFECIGLVPSIQETVEYFENKIAENGNFLGGGGGGLPQEEEKPKWTKSIPRRLLRDLGTQFDEEVAKEECNLLYSHSTQSSEESLTSSGFDYDLIIIGSGSGGSGVVKEGAKLGKKIAICESHWNNQSCINVGCVPKMLLNYAGILGDICGDKRTLLPFGWFAPNEKKELEEEGESCGSIFTNDWETLIDNIQGHILNLKWERQLLLKGIQYFSGNVEFEGPHRIMLKNEDDSTELISGEKIVIDVGSKYLTLDIPGAPGNCVTVEEIFSMRKHPGNVLIVGGGRDAIECAGLLAGLSIEVTIMSRSPALKGFDRRMVTLILETLHNRGVKIMFGWSPTEIKEGKIVFSKHLKTGEKCSRNYDTVVLAIGKKPGTGMLKLEKAEILVDEITQKIWVDSQNMTTALDVYAIGDCAKNGISDASVCYRAGVNLGGRLYKEGGGGEILENDQFVPVFLMTPVQYSCVGLSEEGAVKEYGESSVETYHSRFQPPQYQLGNRHKDVYYAKMITLKTESERVIGLHYLGPNAGEVMQGFVLALKLKATKADMDSMLNIHPTCAEIFSKMTKSSTAEAYTEYSCSC